MRRIVTAGLAAAALLLAASPAWGSGGGKIVFASNRADGNRELYVVNTDGTGEHRLTFNDLFERAPVWSPDGTRIAFAGLAADGNWDIYTVDAAGGDLHRLTTDPERDDNPQWTADGRIVWQHGPFVCPCEGWIMNADGSGQARLQLPGNVLTPDPAPNAPRLAYATDAGGSWSLHVVNLNGTGDRRLTNGPAAFGDFQPRWSPNGDRIAFLRDSTNGNNDVFVVTAGGQDARQLTNTPVNEFWESWTPDGQSLVYTTDDTWRLHRVTLDGAISEVNTSPTAPLTETFDEGTRDASLWHQIDDPGGTIGEQDGRLVASISGSAVPGGQFDQVDEHWGSQCDLNGDFDYQVDYDLVQWPANSGFWAALDAFFAGGAMARTSSSFDPFAGEQYQAWANTTPFVNAVANTTDMTGSFRLTRTDGVMTAYYRSPDSDWTRFLVAPGAGGTTVYGMGLSATAAGFAHLDGAVAYDNFRLSSGVLTCPNWWQDYAPDVSAQ